MTIINYENRRHESASMLRELTGERKRCQNGRPEDFSVFVLNHISNAGNESGWYNVTSSGTLNLTNIVNASTILGSVSLPNGTFNIVRFNVTSAAVTVNSSSGVLSNHIAKVPSGKVQSVITGGVNVRPNTTATLRVDISPTVISANGSYTLIPSATTRPTTPANSNSAATSVTKSNHSTSVSTTTHTS